jgi:predicted nucleic acid-binding protein
LNAALADPEHVFKEAAFMSEVVEAMRQVPRDAIPDMPDRIVAATAVYFGVPVISRDGKSERLLYKRFGRTGAAAGSDTPCSILSQDPFTRPSPPGTVP